MLLDRMIDQMTLWSPLRILGGAVLFSEVVTTVMVAGMSLLFHGMVRWDFVVTGLVTALVASVLVVSLLLRLVQRLQQAEQKAHCASQVKSEFLAAMSHEIRTPMNVMMGAGDVLLATPLTIKQREQVQRQQAAGDILLKLIDQILDFSRIEAGLWSPKEEAIALHALLTEVTDWMRSPARDKGLALECRLAASLPEWVMTDGIHVRQVLFNLLNNAVKFTVQGRIVLTAAVAADAPDLLQVTVEDTGIGMTPEFMARLFLPFTRADQGLTRCHGGAGLGLAISRRLVAQMAGQLTVESQVGQGTVFHLRLPLRPTLPPPAAESPMATVETSHAGGHILLVEDAEDNQLLIHAFLEHSPYRLTMVVNGAEAVQKVRETRFDLVLMDVQMPVMDGYTATRAIRHWEMTNGRPRLPIIALTAHALASDVAQSREAGCDLHVTKPIRKGRLLEILQQFDGSPTPGHAIMITQEKR